ncbi:hypothetical protein [Desulfopila aestuarii]|uniref:DUF106 domain-containing protein n=1 Tax=Desulfopila aestuarii DSM 18488 TaxID=1121416 RepID=A0A1M7Y634_9BACT|nr:hypothetical protein [Desulfopila aestuarii]SHO47847.1 hypothetical protein SAMN02745220_01994 [Desulfopila aestuarii DSM 18488]
MNTITSALLLLDPWLIAPFRWLPSASAGYLLGTVILALYCILLGDLSASLVTFINKKYIRKMQAKMDHNHELSETALKLGDKESFKAVNKQGLDAFGHSFSLGAAIFCVSIWPMPFALAWLSLRFVDAPLELPFHLPFLGNTVEYFPSFLLVYIATRMLYSAIMGRMTWYRTTKARLVGQQLQQS